MIADSTRCCEEFGPGKQRCEHDAAVLDVGELCAPILGRRVCVSVPAAASTKWAAFPARVPEINTGLVHFPAPFFHFLVAGGRRLEHHVVRLLGALPSCVGVHN